MASEEGNGELEGVDEEETESLIVKDDESMGEADAQGLPSEVTDGVAIDEPDAPDTL